MSRFSVGKLFSNPEFLNLLAGIGAGLDPEGPAGAIGKATIAMNQARAARLAQEDQAKKNDAQMSMLTKIMGGPSPAGVEGMRSWKVNPDGSYSIQYDPPHAAPTQNAPQNSTPATPAAPASSAPSPNVPSGDTRPTSLPNAAGISPMSDAAVPKQRFIDTAALTPFFSGPQAYRLVS